MNNGCDETTRQLPIAALNRHITTMQFNPNEPVQPSAMSNNNNNNEMFSTLDKSSNKCGHQLKGPIEDRYLANTSPQQLSSSSSESSQAQNNDDYNASEANNSAPSSPQSSYNSSFGSNSGRKLINSSSNSIAALVPGGVVTTQNISTVIKPKGNNNSLQFVKIQTPELSKKAVEQIRIAEETKISREKIKEVEEEWQNNLLNWKSKRRQQLPNLAEHESNDPFDNSDAGGGRKIKTFAEMLEQRAKSGNRLGFNLQRYIGADDEEDEIDSPSNRQDSDFPRERIDSDCEIQSSASSSFNHLESNSSEISQTVKKELDSSTCDNNSMFSSPTRDKHSISLVQRSEHQQLLNSTLKQGIKPPIFKERLETKPQPPSETDSRMGDNLSEDDSENSCLEEDEEEEQKQLQRIAFEAKLKAFEKLTKPEQAPKLSISKAKQVAPRKPSEDKPLPTRQPNQDAFIVGDEMRPRPTIRPQGTFPSDNASTVRIPPSKTLVEQPAHTSIKINSEPSQPTSPAMSNPPATELTLSGTNQLLLTDTALTPTTSTVQRDKSIAQQNTNSFNQVRASPPSKSEEEKELSLGSKLSNLTLDDNASYKTRTSQAYHPNNEFIHTNDENQSLNSPSQRVQQPSPLPHQLVTPNNAASNPRPLGSQQFTQVYPPPPPIYQNNATIHQHPPIEQLGLPSVADTSSLHSYDGTRQIINCSQDSLNHKRPRNPLNQSSALQDTPKKEAPSSSSKRTARDDKDKTVLSVSGKKRCSSCREELGRGAAAFVVESLSLVYHTNCFRCSVCHVNLSNGFRGVDVRVHAGALHCQNCYSKDGLNYSRV